MQKLPLALFLSAGLILGGCKSNESKPEEATPAPSATTAAASEAAQAAPAPAKPECPPEPATKKKPTAKTKTSKSAKAAPPVDCEPAKPKTEAPASAKAASAPTSTPATAPAPAAGQVKANTACNPCVIKSKDGTFDGEVYGNIPSSSKWARLQIGMHQSEVERILGVTSNIRGYVTAKAFIPFYFGSDSHRYEAVYPGQGSVAYTGGGVGGGQGVLMMINYDAKIQ